MHLKTDAFYYNERAVYWFQIGTELSVLLERYILLQMLKHISWN